MRWRSTARVMAAAAMVAGLAVTGSSAATAGAAAPGMRAAVETPTGPGGNWGVAVPVAGAATGESAAAPPAISCAKPGNCSAVGTFTIAGSLIGAEPYVMKQVNGVWSPAEPVNGIFNFGQPEAITLSAVSCPAVGDCTAAGSWAGPNQGSHVWSVSETGGTWGTAQSLNGVTAPQSVSVADPAAVSCASPGNCAVVGEYSTSASGLTEPFTAVQTGGVWGAAQAVAGLPASVSTDGEALLNAVSCPAAGHCAAAGTYDRGQGKPLAAFVVRETGGTWGTPQDVPGTGALGTGAGADGEAVSCSSAGNCTAGGNYQAPDGTVAGTYVATETAGTWGDARAIADPATGGSKLTFAALACSSAGNCSVAGQYTTAAKTTQAFVADEVSGAVGAAQAIGNTGKSSTALSLSCAPDGSCAVGGQATGGEYSVSGKGSTAFVATRDTAPSGAWENAQPVLGAFPVIGLNSAKTLDSLSCTVNGYCSGVGTYQNKSGTSLPFTVTDASPMSISFSSAPLALSYGAEEKYVIRIQAAGISVQGPPGTPQGKAGAAPGGTIAFTFDGALLCKFTLVKGAGTCTPSATAAKPGTGYVVWDYSGDDTYAPWISGDQVITVKPASTKTVLALSKAEVTLGHESAERLSVKVWPHFAGVPSGKVVIKAGTATVCTITLKAGKGSCTLGARRLRVGTYKLVATYSGNTDFLASASPALALRVKK
jgi:hypothetical protein